MAIEAPFHLQRVRLIHERHLVDWAVTALASHTFINVNAVIEVDEVRQVVHPLPLQGSAGAVAFTHGLEHGRARPYLRVAVHAGFSWRNAGEVRGLDRSVAVTAIKSESADVVLMAERRVLHPRLILPGNVRRALNLRHDPAQTSQQDHESQDAEARQPISTSVKDLRHSEVLNPWNPSRIPVQPLDYEP